MKKILLLTDFASGFSRDLLRGVVKYAKEHGPWVFYRLPRYYLEQNNDQAVLDWAEKWGADAIIAQLSDINFQALQRLNIPIIVQNYRERDERISNITGDYFGTGVMAADFFLHRGYKNFAYYGLDETIWMRERADGYRSEVEKHGMTVHAFSSPEKVFREPGSWTLRAERVMHWLHSLPKPIALFACDDSYALEITELCKQSEINIPEDIAILGVDNDELLCNISDPRLSSIELDVTSGGYEVGALLDHYFKGEILPPLSHNITIKPVRIIPRSSTERVQVMDKYVAQALAQIEQEYAEELTVERLLARIPLSRRVFERRFKQEIHMTIYQYIQEFRIERFADLLQTSDCELTEAAFMSGFRNYKNVSRVFTKKKQMTPSQYREKHRVVKNDAF